VEAASWMAVSQGEWAIVKQFLTPDCSGPSSALAYPCGKCFTDNIATTHIVTCLKQKA
jgi:predicted nucleic acid binding AN1-type Zn finger protein